MRVLICGSRSFNNFKTVKGHIVHLCEIHPLEELIIIEGGATGPDSYAATTAHLLDLKLVEFPADWKRYGKAAGMIRNK